MLKGFVATGILYMPKNIKNGGWLWGIAAMALSFLLTQLCVRLLLQARGNRKGAQYTNLAFLSMGLKGQYLSDFFLTIA